MNIYNIVEMEKKCPYCKVKSKIAFQTDALLNQYKSFDINEQIIFGCFPFKLELKGDGVIKGIGVCERCLRNIHVEIIIKNGKAIQIKKISYENWCEEGCEQ